MSYVDRHHSPRNVAFESTCNKEIFDSKNRLKEKKQFATKWEEDKEWNLWIVFVNKENNKKRIRDLWWMLHQKSIGGKIIITTFCTLAHDGKEDREGATLQISFGTVNYWKKVNKTFQMREESKAIAWWSE